MSSAYFMMERLLLTKDQLQLKLTVCVYDQAIYAKVHQIKCKEPAKFKDTFLMICTFHIILTFLEVIATQFKGTVLQDVVIKFLRLLDASNFSEDLTLCTEL